MKGLRILAYHRVLPDRTAQSRGVLAVTVANFTSQLEHFLRRGWQCLTLSQLHSDYLATGKDPQKTLLLTFDDGYKDNYLHAFPILKQFGLRATIFVTTGFIGEQADLYFSRLPRPYTPEAIDQSLSAEEIKEMEAYGIEFGSHTHTHPRLTTLNKEQLLHELSHSRAILEQILFKKVTSFCYPYGDVNEYVIEAVRAAGYAVGVVTPPRPGIPVTPYTLRRVGLYLDDSPLRFRLKMSSAFHTLRETRLWRKGKTI